MFITELYGVVYTFIYLNYCSRMRVSKFHFVLKEINFFFPQMDFKLIKRDNKDICNVTYVCVNLIVLLNPLQAEFK